MLEIGGRTMPIGDNPAGLGGQGWTIDRVVGLAWDPCEHSPHQPITVRVGGRSAACAHQHWCDPSLPGEVAGDGIDVVVHPSVEDGVEGLQRPNGWLADRVGLVDQSTGKLLDWLVRELGPGMEGDALDHESYSTPTEPPVVSRPEDG